MKPTGDGGDREFDGLLSREVSRAAATPGACPQVDLLSAWFDRSLPDGEAAEVEAHLASCPRCQEVLGHLARTEPEVLYVHTRREVTPWTWHLRWAVPLAAAAIVVFVVGTRQLIAPDTGPRVVPAPQAGQMTQNADREQAERAEQKEGRAEGGSVAALPSRNEIAASTAVAPSAKPVPTDSPSRKPVPTASETLPTKSAVASETSPPKTVFANAKAESAAATRKGAQTVPPPLEEARVAQDSARLVEGALPAAPPPPPTPSAAPPPQGREAAKPSAAVAAPPSQVGLGMQGQRSARADLVAAHPREPQLTAFVPGSSAGWHYASPGVVRRTLDGGAQWIEQPLPGGARLLALSAVSPSLCWAAGAGGVILRTTDGSTWQTVASPTTSDIESVAALDDHRATIRTSDGVTYDTGDGGATWRRR